MTTLEKVLFLKNNGVSITFLAKLAECAPQTLNNWVKGNTTISVRMEKSIIQGIEKFMERMEEIRNDK